MRNEPAAPQRRDGVEMTARPGVRSPLTVAVGGLGAIGLAVARRLDAGIEGLRLVERTMPDHDEIRIASLIDNG